MNCKSFCDRIFLFQADELPAVERAACEAHLHACSGCAARLALEDEALDALRAGLARSAAPPGLESRVRSSLRAAGPTQVPWYRASWLAAAGTAAVLLGLALVLPQLGGPDGPAAPTQLAQGVVTVVDLDCDRAGRDLAHQRGCRDPHHVNALKRDDGSYWTMDPTSPEFRYLLLDREQRGAKLRIVGRRLGGSSVIRLESVETAALESAPQGFMLAWNRSRIAARNEVGIR